VRERGSSITPSACRIRREGKEGEWVLSIENQQEGGKTTSAQSRILALLQKGRKKGEARRLIPRRGEGDCLAYKGLTNSKREGRTLCALPN